MDVIGLWGFSCGRKVSPPLPFPAPRTSRASPPSVETQYATGAEKKYSALVKFSARIIKRGVDRFGVFFSLPRSLKGRLTGRDVKVLGIIYNYG